MTRQRPITAFLLSAVCALAFNGCRTTVVQPVEQPTRHDDHPDDHHPPPPPDHRDDRHDDHRG